MRARTVFLALGPAGCQASVSAVGTATADGQGDAEGGGRGTPSCVAVADGDPKADRGATPTLSGNHTANPLLPGVYHGDLVVSGNHVSVCGAGADKVRIDGALVLGGNHNVVTGITVARPSKIGGNHNSAKGTTFEADVVVGGNHSER